MCDECGLWKETNGTFTLIEPSDCHDKGGHYVTEFDKNGEQLYTNRPWQIGNKHRLTPEEMEASLWEVD